jgi:hypothetical protein
MCIGPSQRKCLFTVAKKKRLEISKQKKEFKLKKMQEENLTNFQEHKNSAVV